MTIHRVVVCAALIGGCAAEQPRGQASRNEAGAPEVWVPAETPKRWQYAILYGNGGGNYTFLSGANIIYNGSPENFDKLYRALNGGGDQGAPALGNRTAVLLEALGRQGWELVAVTGEEQLEFGRWYFKRPLP